MPLVQIHMLQGRSAEMKKQLIQEVTHAVAHALQANPQSIRVLLSELPLENWAVGGKSKAEEANEK